MKSTEGARNITLARMIVYALLAFVLAAFQTAVGQRIAFFGATPQLTLALTCAASCFYGPLTGVYAALVCGFFTEAVGGVGVVTLPLFYVVTAWMIGVFTAEKQGGSKILSASLSLGAGVLSGALISVVRLVIGGGKPNIFLGFLYIALPEALNTLIYGAIVFLIHGVVFFIAERKNGAEV